MKFSRLNYSEPSVLRGIITAVLALAAALGFATTTEINGVAEALIPIFAFCIPLVQSLWTRAAVFSPAAVRRLTAPGTPQTPGVADHGA